MQDGKIIKLWLKVDFKVFHHNAKWMEVAFLFTISGWANGGKRGIFFDQLPNGLVSPVSNRLIFRVFFGERWFDLSSCQFRT